MLTSIEGQITILAKEVVDIVDAHGGDHADPGAKHTAEPLLQEIRHLITSNLKLPPDPLSSEYLEAQLALYKAISGREYEPPSGELCNQHNLFQRIHSANPYGSRDQQFIGNYSYQCSLILKLVGPVPRPRILDLGCGTGTTSEIFAFSGCDVTSFDLDPQLAELAKARSVMRGLGINRIIGQYDDLEEKLQVPQGEDEKFDLAVFFASLHHSMHHRKLLRVILECFLADEGIIAFADEPINNLFWEDWGIRLDIESVYVAAKFGWLETGWSYDYLHSLAKDIDCFLIYVQSSNFRPVGLFVRSGAEASRILLRAHNLGLIAEASSARPCLSNPAMLSNLRLSLACALPEKFPADSRAQIVVSLLNGTSYTLSTVFADYPISFSYIWKTADGVVVCNNGIRTKLSGPIREGQHVLQIVDIDTPMDPGDYVLVLTLVQDGLQWLEANASFLPLKLDIKIE